MQRLFPSFIVLMFLLPFFLCGGEWWGTVVGNLDHCTLLGCDFQRHYLPQGELLRNGSTELQSGFFYPPLLAILLWPLSYLSSLNALIVWYAMQMAAVFGLGMLAFSVERRGALWSALIFPLITVSVLHNLKWGQVSVLLNLLLLIALFKRGWMGGILIGLCTALKGYPILFLGYGFLKKDWPMVAVAISSSVVLGILLPVMLLGGEQTWIFYDNMQSRTAWVAANAAGGGGQALSPALTRYFVDASMLVGGQFKTTPLLFSLSEWGIPFLFVGIMYILGRCTFFRWNVLMEVEQISIVFLVGGLALTPGWVHYLAFIPFVQWVLFYRYNGVAKGLVIASIALQSLPVLTLPFGSDGYFFWAAWGMGMLSVLCLFVAILIANREDRSAPELPVDESLSLGDE